MIKHHHFGDIATAAQGLSKSMFLVCERNIYFNRTKNVSKRCIRIDKSYHIETVLGDASRALACGDIKRLYQAASNVSQFALAKPRAVYDSSGELTCTDGECGNAFVDHFAGVLKATKNVNTKSMVSTHFHIPRAEQSSPPSFNQSSEGIRSLPHGKAVGLDGIPAAILKLVGPSMAHIFHALLQAIWSQMYVPISWRWGRLVELHKKDSTLITDNYRGLLVSNSLSKAFTSVLNHSTGPYYQAAMPSNQCGGTNERSTDLASHLVRSAFEFAKLRIFLIRIVYVDLIEAFDHSLN